MIGDLTKRFWEVVSVKSLDAGYGVYLDQRMLSTPAKARLLVPTRALADAIAVEWEAQVEKIDPGTMPFTRTANAAIDKVSVQKTEVADLLLEYADSDLLCYRAESPASLVARQNENWDPLLDWVKNEFGISLQQRVGVIHQAQNAEDLKVFSKQVYSFSNFELAAFHDLVSLSGSLVIGLAAMRNYLPAESLWNASRVDEIWQQEQWGADEEAGIVNQIKRSAFLDASNFAQNAKIHA